MPDDIIEVKVDNFELNSLLLETKNKVHNRAPLMLEISEIMQSAVEMQFETEGYHKWPELSQFTKDQRTKKGTWPGKMLQDSLQLINSVQAGYSQDMAAVYTNKTYAPKQNFGFDGIEQVSSHTRKNKKTGKTSQVRAHVRTLKIKPRPFFKLEDRDMTAIIKATKSFLTKS